MTRRRLVLLCTAAICALALIGCNRSASTPLPPSTARPTRTPTLTSTPSATLVPTPTRTLVPSQTPVPALVISDYPKEGSRNWDTIAEGFELGIIPSCSEDGYKLCGDLNWSRLNDDLAMARVLALTKGFKPSVDFVNDTYLDLEGVAKDEVLLLQELYMQGYKPARLAEGVDEYSLELFLSPERPKHYNDAEQYLGPNYSVYWPEMLAKGLLAVYGPEVADKLPPCQAFDDNGEQILSDIFCTGPIDKWVIAAVVGVDGKPPIWEVGYEAGVAGVGRLVTRRDGGDFWVGIYHFIQNKGADLTSSSLGRALFSPVQLEPTPCPAQPWWTGSLFSLSLGSELPSNHPAFGPPTCSNNSQCAMNYGYCYQGNCFCEDGKFGDGDVCGKCKYGKEDGKNGPATICYPGGCQEENRSFCDDEPSGGGGGGGGTPPTAVPTAQPTPGPEIPPSGGGGNRERRGSEPEPEKALPYTGLLYNDGRIPPGLCVDVDLTLSFEAYVTAYANVWRRDICLVSGLRALDKVTSNDAPPPSPSPYWKDVTGTDAGRMDRLRGRDYITELFVISPHWDPDPRNLCPTCTMYRVLYAYVMNMLTRGPGFSEAELTLGNGYDLVDLVEFLASAPMIWGPDPAVNQAMREQGVREINELVLSGAYQWDGPPVIRPMDGMEVGKAKLLFDEVMAARGE